MSMITNDQIKLKKDHYLLPFKGKTLETLVGEYYYCLWMVTFFLIQSIFFLIMGSKGLNRIL